MTRGLSLLLALAALACAAPVAFADELTPEACVASASCRADADGNGAITVTDFAAFFGAYGRSWAAACLADPVCRFDFDGNGTVTPTDFATMLSVMNAQGAN